jgi:hypothetical protein
MFSLAVWDWNGIIGGLVSFSVVLYIQRRHRINKSRLTSGATIAFAALVAYIWAPIGFPNSDWSRAPIGSDVVRLIPIVNFDPNLLQTQWLPMQAYIGASTFLLATIALYGDSRRAAFAVIGIMALGLEISQAASNYFTSITPPYRVDIHDILARALGAFVGFVVLRLFAAFWRLVLRPRVNDQTAWGKLDTLIRRI